MIVEIVSKSPPAGAAREYGRPPSSPRPAAPGEGLGQRPKGPHVHPVALVHVHQGVLQHGTEDEDEADHHPDVNRLDVRHPRQLRQKVWCFYDCGVFIAFYSIGFAIVYNLTIVYTRPISK